MNRYLSIIILVLLVCFVVGCQDKEAFVEIFIEDGVEVVQNVLPTQDQLIHSTLSPIFSIDTENEVLAGYGLTNIWGFDVNSSGEIFIYNSPLSQGDFVLKFDKTGQFINSFGRKGQGPGEIQMPLYQKINSKDEVSILDFAGQKLIVFDKDGDILSESKPEIRIFDRGILLPLMNGGYVYRNLEMDASRENISLALFLLGPDLEQIVELGRASIVNPRTANKFIYPYPVLTWALSNRNIFIGMEERGYDIHVFNLEGQLIRKIRKEYTRVPFTDQDKNQALKRWENYGPLSKKIRTPDFHPPFQHIFSDETGRLFVVTFEPGIEKGEYMTDVFDSDGVLLSRLSLGLLLNKQVFLPDGHWDSWVAVKNNILYHIREKESGYKELMAYEIIWE
jgi:hypothetical protein